MFSSNGVRVFGADQEQIENGFGLNPGALADAFPDGYPCPQGAIVLPSFNMDSLFYLFHLRNLQDPYAIVDRIYYTEVDMSKNGGQGEVLDKNVSILSDSLSLGMLTAVRHGNGRDWWVFKPEKLSNGYWRILFSPWGFGEPEKQYIGHSFTGDDGRGQAAFSPDGTKYARYDIRNDLHLFDFDRCTGLMSNTDSIPIHDLADTLSAAGGVAFSPNSRFLYVPSFTKLYQFDTWADNVAASMVTVGEWDGFASPFSTTFYMAQLGPDGRIYINGHNSVNVLHVVNQPDSAGLACQFEQHAIITPTLVLFGMPHFPNYRLGKWAGSPCDSMLTSGLASVEPTAFDIRVSPNPADQETTVDITTTDYASLDRLELEFYDGTGRSCGKWRLHAYSPLVRVVMGHLAQGAYYFVLLDGGRVVASKTVAVKH
ncbi:MAG: hypothetical protein K9J37_07800 [Saprospiraceae bacterium]|nr:hypothetical protein [Saprospiraceae bacterium]MCF8249801.1 hypothetical protein [Saprospiraceae bacterium]MCF8313448.1 hypothetical protein [Saprospiraceae bacterium]MCF8442161.1 hypothetical protein [Saprospiraceae bacterium]